MIRAGNCRIMVKYTPPVLGVPLSPSSMAHVVRHLRTSSTPWSFPGRSVQREPGGAVFPAVSSVDDDLRSCIKVAARDQEVKYFRPR